jgi:hypothetical protein
MNLGDKPTKISFIGAGAYTVVAIFAIAYSLIIYLYRSQAIRGRKAIKYHDGLGPTILCVGFFTAVAINVWYELGKRGHLKNSPLWPESV